MLMILSVLSLVLPQSSQAMLSCPMRPTLPFQYCYFDKMPLYDQSNPNFAVPVAPDSIVSAEHNPQPDVYKNICGTNVSVDNPYYKSWLPMGPFPGDPGTIWYWNKDHLSCGYTLTATCGPTSESMALMAAIKHKSANTLIGGWTSKYFLQAEADPTQPGFLDTGASNPSPANPVPAPPALVDASSNPTWGLDAPLARPQMTWNDIQRVVNMAILQKTDPSAGGGMGAFLGKAGDFSQLSVLSALPQPSPLLSAANTTSLDPGAITPSSLVGLVRNGWAATIAIHTYTVHVTKPRLGRSVVTFTFNGGGHVLALNGYFQDSLLIYDPFYGQRRWAQLGTIAGGAYADSKLPQLEERTVILPYPGASTAAFWQGLYANQKFTGDVWDLNDGDQVTFVDGATAIQVQ